MFKRILAATDFNELATAAMRLAAGIASRSGGELTVVYADRFEPPAEFTAAQFASMVESIEASQRAAKRELDAYLDKHLAGLSIRYRGVVADGSTAESILRLAGQEGSELIVMGTHGRGGIERLITGSVAERVIAESNVPVLTVRSTSVPWAVQRVCVHGDFAPQDLLGGLSASLGAETAALGSLDDPLGCDIIALPASDARRPQIRHVRTPVLFIPPTVVAQ